MTQYSNRSANSTKCTVCKRHSHSYSISDVMNCITENYHPHHGLNVSLPDCFFSGITQILVDWLFNNRFAHVGLKTTNKIPLLFLSNNCFCASYERSFVSNKFFPIAACFNQKVVTVLSLPCTGAHDGLWKECGNFRESLPDLV